jgi:hypothetical protein
VDYPSCRETKLEQIKAPAGTTAVAAEHRELGK